VFVPEINPKSKKLDPVSKLAELMVKVHKDSKKLEKESYQTSTTRSPVRQPIIDESIIPDDEDMSPVKSFFKDRNSKD
jgi:hypothetical protein